MFFLLLFVTVLGCNQVIAMQEQQKHAQPMELGRDFVFKTTQCGNRVLLPVNPIHKADFLLSRLDLTAKLRSRISRCKYKTSINRKDKDLFMKHHLALLVTSYHRDDFETFKLLLELPEIKNSLFNWQELGKAAADNWFMEEEKTGTISQYVCLHQNDENNQPVRNLERYKQLLLVANSTAKP